MSELLVFILDQSWLCNMIKEMPVAQNTELVWLDAALVLGVPWGSVRAQTHTASLFIGRTIKNVQ